MQTDPQKTYNAAQNLINRGSRFGRTVLFRNLGGTVQRPEKTIGYPDENEWQATLYGITRTASTCDKAILNWASAAQASVTRRATDGRPDCPHNGAAPAPQTTPTPAA